MLCRVTNDTETPVVIYDVKIRPHSIVPGKIVDIDIDEETYERHRALALAKCGPGIELLEQPVEDEDYGPDVIGEDQPHKPRRKYKRRKAKRQRRVVVAAAEHGGDDGERSL